MKERNPMPIRKFSLIGLIALGLIIISLVGELFTFSNDIYTNIQTYVVLISQIIGNTLFGVALIGYFLHLKENKPMNVDNINNNWTFNLKFNDILSIEKYNNLLTITLIVTAYPL